MAPTVDLIAWAIPSLPLAFEPTGQLGCLLLPGLLANSSLIALRCLVKTYVVPLPSARTTTLMSVLGSFTPGLASATALSFHLVILPRKMPT